MLRIGTILKGYCEGYFGLSYEDKRIEAIGTDWIVAREIDSGVIQFASFENEKEFNLRAVASVSRRPSHTFFLLLSHQPFF